MSLRKLKIGDKVTYKDGRVNYVNKPWKYLFYFDKELKNEKLGEGFEIVKIERYVRFLCFYRLKTIYKKKVSK